METSLKTFFVQIFSCCPKNLSCPKFWGGWSPPRPPPPARTPMVSIFQGLLLVIVIMIDGNEKRNFMLHSKFQSFHVIEKYSKRCLLNDDFTLDIESSFKLNVACRGPLSNFG